MTESFGHFGANLALPVDEGEKVDGLFGATNGVQHRRKDFAPVVQHRNSIALGRRDPHGSLKRASRAAHLFFWSQRRASRLFIAHVPLLLREMVHSRDLTRRPSLRPAAPVRRFSALRVEPPQRRRKIKKCSTTNSIRAMPQRRPGGRTSNRTKNSTRRTDLSQLLPTPTRT